MADRHKQTPISIRPPDDLRDWLYAYAQHTGRPVRALILQALQEFRTRAENQREDPR